MRRLIPVLLLAAGLLGGCPEKYANRVGTDIPAVTAIRKDTSLTPQQKRDRLTDLGFDPVTINALLIDERLANQFGGDLRTAYTKVTSDRLDLLTPDEVQVYGDEASAVSTTGLDVSIKDDQAQAIVTFFADNHIRTRAELSNYLGDPQNVVPDAIPTGVLKPLFVDFDPSLLLPKLP